VFAAMLRRRLIVPIALTTLCLARLSLWAGELTVHVDFEGGSARVLRCDAAQRRVRIAPGGDGQRGWPCWWYVRVDGLASGQRLVLEVVPSPEIMPQGKNAGRPLAAAWCQPQQAAWSPDNHHWHQTDAGTLGEGGVMAYEVTATGPSLWLAWGPPLTPQSVQGLLARLTRERPWAQVCELARSREGRACLALRLSEGELPARQRLAIWVQARQHAWEAGSSWVARGLAEWLVSDHPRAAALRQKSELWIVPIMDVDNVATGNGGKEAFPQDHNRDWTDQPFYPEVAAAQRHLLRLAEEGRLALFLDLHNPAPSDVRPFFFVCPDETLTETGRRNLDRWLVVCRAEMNGPLVLSDQPRVSGASYDPLWKQMSKNWVAAHAPPFAVAATLETAWNTPASNTAGYRTLGMQLGLAIERYLREDPRR
jgi:hypothetical protein